MKKIISIFAVFLVLVFSILPCFAVEYSTEFPSYVPISGGAFLRLNLPLGKLHLSVRITTKQLFRF